MLQGIKKIITENETYKKRAIKKHANYLASSIKRLDVAAAQIAHLFSLNSKLSVKNKECLEVGGGWLFSHALVFYLLGAKKIVITDIEPLARPQFIGECIKKSSISVIRDILSPYEDHELLRERLNYLANIKEFNFDELKKIGIEYKQPVVWELKPLSEKFDFVFSNVVLEYFTEENLIKVLNNLRQCLSQNGEMLHTIHLEDHDSSNPFDYLKEDKDFYLAKKHQTHSNRIRFSTYDELFLKLGLSYSYLYKWIRSNVALPSNIDSNLKYTDESDIRTSHFAVYMSLK